MEPNIKPLGEEDLIHIFTSRNFLARLRRAAELSWETGHESGFIVCRDIYKNQLIYGDVIGGFDPEYNSAQNPTSRVGRMFGRSVEPSLIKHSLDPVKNEAYVVVDFHLHPFPATFMPSEKDLDYFFEVREDYYEPFSGFRINCRPLYLIGSMPRPDRNLEILLLQETGGKPLRESYAGILSSCVEHDPRFSDHNHVIVELFQKRAGIQADILTYELACKNYYLMERDLSKLARYASCPAVLGFA